MPVHPKPTPGVGPKKLRPKDLREMVVLAAVCVISTIVFVPPLAGVARSTPRHAARRPCADAGGAQRRLQPDAELQHQRDPE